MRSLSETLVSWDSFWFSRGANERSMLLGRSSVGQIFLSRMMF
jgi:hypothetical protein